MNEPYDPNRTVDIPAVLADALDASFTARLDMPAEPLGATDPISGASNTLTMQPGDSPAADTPASGLPLVPGYRVLREIARGGMGRVLAAHDLTLDREVALKILLPKANADRFVRESKITARLPHPGIPPVYALGTLADGSPFLAMKLIAGQTLADELKTADWASRPRLLQAFTQVCQAVGFAHSRGVIHRDLKPANIMVGAFGDVQVMDWGLAKDMASRERERPEELAEELAPVAHAPGSPEDTDRTQAGQVLGTPAYMAPEQARGEATDARADVFALGGILCAVLTGEPPYRGPDMPKLIKRAGSADLAEAFARLDGCGADADLVALCKSCLARRPGERPADAGEVAQAIARFRASTEERARRAELARAAAEVRVAEQKKRRWVQAALGLTFTSLVVLGGAFAWWAQEQHRAGRTQAVQAVERAMQDAVARYARARGADSDLTLWADARAAAIQAQQQAIAADAPLEVRHRADALRSEIEQIGRNRRLVTELLAIHAGMGDRLANDGNQDFESGDKRYTQAFRDYGTDLFKLTPEEGADLLLKLGGEVKVVLAAAIDDWAYVRVFRHDPRALFQLTMLLDPDPMRNRIRDAAARGDVAALKAIMEEIDPAVHSAETVNLVAVFCFYYDSGRDARGPGAFLRKAQPHHPSDFQINHNLAFYLLRSKLYSEALPYCIAAIAVRPQSAAACLDLARAYQGLQREDEAIAAYRRVVELSPNAWGWLEQVVSILKKQGKTDEAEAEHRKAAELALEFPHPGRGNEFARRGQWSQAANQTLAEVAANPSERLLWPNPASQLLLAGDVEGYRQLCRRMVEQFRGTTVPAQADSVCKICLLRPDAADRSKLPSKVLVDAVEQGTARKDYVGYFYGCMALIAYRDGQFEQAADASKKSLAINKSRNPDGALALLVLAMVQHRSKQADQARQSLAQATALIPYELATLGSTDFQGSLPVSASIVHPDWLIAEILRREAALLIHNDANRPPEADRLRFAQRARDQKKFALAARLLAESLEANPKLGDDRQTQHRYHAACYAALAAAGQGKDEVPLDDTAKAQLRRQALDWLKAELTAWTKLLESGAPQDRPTIVKTLSHWQQDSDLAGIRDAEALAKLPADEQKAFAQLWAEVAELLKKAETPATKDTKP